MRPSTRRAMILTATTALTVSLAPAASSTAAPTAAPAADTAATAKRDVGLNLTVQPLWSGTNESLTTVGEVFDASTYRPLTGRRISIQARNVGSTTWRTVATPESNSNGAFLVRLTADRSKTYRAVYAGNAWYSYKQSNWERQRAKPGTKVRTSVKLKATSNGGSKVTGRVTQLWSNPVHPLKGVSVYIQARQAYGSYWFDAGATRTNSLGYYNWNTSVKPSACYRYRAIYKGNSSGWAAKSATGEWTSCG
ncbi:hypothetical protein DUHN55_15350 [Helicobacter pylori]